MKVQSIMSRKSWLQGLELPDQIVYLVQKKIALNICAQHFNFSFFFVLHSSSGNGTTHV